MSSIEDSKIILDVDKRNFKICWENKDNILRRVGVDNKAIPIADWVNFFHALEDKYSDAVPEMWSEFTYADEKYCMRAYITPVDEGFQLTLRDLPRDVFGRKYKVFTCSSMLECYESGYAYVTSTLESYTEDIVFWRNKCKVFEEECTRLEEENKQLKADKKELLQILDDISEKESLKAANEREKLKVKPHELEYHYDYDTESFKQVDHFDEFGQAVLKKRGFPFNAEVGMRIIFLYHCKNFKPKQIVNQMSLHGLNKSPDVTVANFIRVYNKGLLERAIMFCCNNSHYDIRYTPEELLKYPERTFHEKAVI